MASSLKMVAPLAALLFLFAISTPASSQSLGGLLGGVTGLVGGVTGGLLGSGTGGLLGGVTGAGLTNITGSLLCSTNLLLCPTSGSCPPLVNATVSLNLGNVLLAQNVTNAAGVFQLIPALPISNILGILPNLTVRITLPATGCNALPANSVLSSPLAVTQALGNILTLLPTSFL